MSTFGLINELFVTLIGFVMDQKPNATPPSSNQGASPSSDALNDLRTSATMSSAEIRKDVDRATGKIADKAEDVKDRAADATREVKGEIVDGAQDIKDTVTDAAATAKEGLSRVADKVQKTGEKAIEATRAFASDAVNVAGQKVRDAQGRLDDAKGKATDYIHEDPVRAVTYTAIGTAIVTAALIGIFRRR
jgi:ElaB/YqjD/DUF883 family membrane-anchored ribosome-binding protein